MLVEKPQLVQGREVLEIGSGTGLCGIVAAKLGASKVSSHLITLLTIAGVFRNSRRNGAAHPFPSCGRHRRTIERSLGSRSEQGLMETAQGTFDTVVMTLLQPGITATVDISSGPHRWSSQTVRKQCSSTSGSAPPPTPPQTRRTDMRCLLLLQQVSHLRSAPCPLAVTGIFTSRSRS